MGLGMLLFVTPWVLNRNGFSAGSLAPSILGAFFMLAAGSMLTKIWENISRLANLSVFSRPASQMGAISVLSIVFFILLALILFS